MENNMFIDSLSHKQMDKQFGIECARWGWKAYHEKDSRGSRKGWPDWVASNGVKTIFAEFKTVDDHLTEDQYEWIVNLLQSNHACYIIRPATFGKLLELIIRGSARSKSNWEDYRDTEYMLMVATSGELVNYKGKKK